MSSLKGILDTISARKTEASYTEAKATKTCVICGKPAISFRSDLARLEYRCSAICQQCQDEFFLDSIT